MALQEGAVSKTRSRLASLIALDFSLADWPDAVRGTLVTALVTTIPVLTGNLEKAIPLSIGAAFIAISESGQEFSRRWRATLWTTAGLMLAVGLGSALSNVYLLAIAVTGIVAFACGVIGFLGPRFAVGGLLSLVLFAIYVGVPVPLDGAFTSAALVGLGGIVQALASMAMGITRGKHRLPKGPREPLPSVADMWRQDHTFVAHGIRLAIVMVIATAISESVAIPHPYWLPMSVAWMSKPDHEGTVVRVLHRLVGTVTGLLIAFVVVAVVRPSGSGFLPLALIGVALAIAFIWVNYAIAVTGVTIWVVSLFAMVGDPVTSTMNARLLATAGAAALVLIAAWIPARLPLPGHRHSLGS
jgi:uncharacterized membrane protein YccC